MTTRRTAAARTIAALTPVVRLLILARRAAGALLLDAVLIAGITIVGLGLERIHHSLSLIWVGLMMIVGSGLIYVANQRHAPKPRNTDTDPKKNHDETT